MQRRFSLLVCLLAAIAIFAAPQAFADGIKVGDTIRFLDREGSTNGGEYGVAKLPAVSTELFRTFCVQRNEFLDFNAAGFVVDNISTKIELNGSDLKPQTAFLYTQFRAGTLDSSSFTGGAAYDYSNGTAGHIASANALQDAFWHLQDGKSLGSLNALASSFVSLANDAVDNLWGSSLGNVRVLNIVWATTRGSHTAGSHAQDVLVLIPTPMASVAGMGLMGGIVACGVIRRRAKNALI